MMIIKSMMLLVSGGYIDLMSEENETQWREFGCFKTA